jgi:small GTP-binding protein
MEEPESLKVVLLGESGVGKTSIISQFTTSNFNPRVQTSVSAQFVSKTLDFPEFGKTIKFDIWDTVGQEKYRSLAKIFYKDAKVIIFVYDVTSLTSMNALREFWHKETLNNADNDPLFAVVANKIDLYSNLQVKNEEGKAFADEINAIFQPTSALNSSGIDKLFVNIGKKILKPDYDYQESDKKAQENFKQKQNEDYKKEKKTRIQIDSNSIKEEKKNGNKKKKKLLIN